MSPRTSLIVFGYGRGISVARRTIGTHTFEFRQCGAYHTRRVYQPESLANIRVCARLGGLHNASASAIRSADAILDISGGDSFSDIYGSRRFRAVTLPKIITLQQNKPLILLPQTFGPFKKASNASVAKRIVSAATMSWARDTRSFCVLQELLGRSFDPEKHRVGVDVAFGLPATRPSDSVLGYASDWLEDKGTAIVGINVSGLLHNAPDAATAQYGFRADYRQVITAFIGRLLSETGDRILLVPHVVSSPGHYESDIQACLDVADSFPHELGVRVAVSPVVSDPCEAKWIISRCKWFCGTRMHSAIAALSSGVPAAGISYSPKTLGVFESCGQGEGVTDLRNLTSEEAIEQLWRAYLGRENSRLALEEKLPMVLHQARVQLEEILSTCCELGSVQEHGFL
ncbi:MAG: polysaccharide pyruvyl transferase family protein [Candidatus Hydrogenedentes bacterium]|nr:polysaccharide pyruvyl transferase family protein [Candidatus Hydrogenedentota bacterium]